MNFLACILDISLTFYKTWVVLLLWRWFAVPNFDAPELSFLSMCGLLWLVAAIRPARVTRNEVEGRKAEDSFFESVCYLMAYTTALVSGFIAHHIT